MMENNTEHSLTIIIGFINKSLVRQNFVQSDKI